MLIHNTLKWILIILIILVIIFLWNNYLKKKRYIKLKKRLITNWGREKNEHYYNFFSIKQYFENNMHQHNAFHILSDSNVEDLNLEAIFKFIDRTSSKIGQQYLYYKLRTIQTIDQLSEFSKLTSLFQNNKEIRVKFQLLLIKLNTHNNYDFEALVNDKPIEKPSYLKYIYALSFLAISIVLLSFYHLGFLLLLTPIFAINIIFHYKNKQNITYYSAAFFQFLKTLKIAEELAKEPKIKNHFKDFTFITKLKKMKLKTEFVSFDNRIEEPITAILWFFIELVKIQFNIGTLVFYNFINSIATEKESLDKLFQFIGKIDSAIAIASVKSGKLKTCKPQFINVKTIEVKEIKHPLIENCISNSIKLDNSSLLLTGSNMSGKTTFIRTIAINSVLAQSFNFCFAKEFSSPFLKVYTSIKIADEILNDTSYYLKEVLTIKKLIDASKEKAPHLFVLDEIFKGTNTIERISGGKAILAYLNKANHFVMVSTHDIELTDLLQRNKYDLYHFTESIIDNKLHFDHKLKKGKLKTRNAIKILALHNYPKEIIEEAKKVEKNVFLSK